MVGPEASLFLECACVHGCPFPGLPAAEVTAPRHKEQRREEQDGCSCQGGEEVTPTGPGLQRRGPGTPTRGPTSLLYPQMENLTSVGPGLSLVFSLPFTQ